MGVFNAVQATFHLSRPQSFQNVVCMSFETASTDRSSTVRASFRNLEFVFKAATISFIAANW